MWLPCNCDSLFQCKDIIGLFTEYMKNIHNKQPGAAITLQQSLVLTLTSSVGLLCTPLRPKTARTPLCTVQPSPTVIVLNFYAYTRTQARHVGPAHQSRSPMTNLFCLMRSKRKIHWPFTQPLLFFPSRFLYHQERGIFCPRNYRALPLARVYTSRLRPFHWLEQFNHIFDPYAVVPNINHAAIRKVLR